METITKKEILGLFIKFLMKNCCSDEWLSEKVKQSYFDTAMLSALRGRLFGEYVINSSFDKWVARCNATKNTPKGYDMFRSAYFSFGFPRAFDSKKWYDLADKWENEFLEKYGKRNVKVIIG